jgi:thiosulfate reductase / polysulfide reductase chain A
VISEKLEKSGIPSLASDVPPPRPPEGCFRLTFGRCAVHNQVYTVNNPMLFEIMPENVLWINAGIAQKMGIS